MTKTRTLFFSCAAMLALAAGLQGACDDTIAANNCKVKCQDTDNTCVQSCTDDSCKTVCKTDLDNCTATCDSVTATPPANDGGAK